VQLYRESFLPGGGETWEEPANGVGRILREERGDRQRLPEVSIPIGQRLVLRTLLRKEGKNAEEKGRIVQ